MPVVPGSHQRELEFKVPYLMEGTSYEFQVVAENKKGFSEPLVTAADVHPRKMTGIFFCVGVWIQSESHNLNSIVLL